MTTQPIQSYQLTWASNGAQAGWVRVHRQAQVLSITMLSKKDLPKLQQLMGGSLQGSCHDMLFMGCMWYDDNAWNAGQTLSLVPMHQQYLLVLVLLI